MIKAIDLSSYTRLQDCQLPESQCTITDEKKIDFTLTVVYSLWEQQNDKSYKIRSYAIR